MIIETLRPHLVEPVARFLIQQRREEGLLDRRLWLTDRAEQKLAERLTYNLSDPDEQIWLVLKPDGYGVLGVLGARAKTLGLDDIRRTYLPPHYGLLQLTTMGVEAGWWQEVLPALWQPARQWLLKRGVTQPQAWLNCCNGEAAHAWQALGFEELMDNAVRPISEFDRFPLDLPSGFRVRAASLRDTKRLIPLFIEELEYHANLPGGYWVPLGSDTPRLARREIELFLTAGPSYTYLIAEQIHDGQILGYMSASVAPLVPENPNALFHPPTRSVLQVAITNGSARGRGIGNLLLSHLLAWFWQQKMTSVSLSYDIRNPLSGPFWRDHGFQPLRQALVINLE